ncbi:FAD/NAD(P)-binding domain-containing protein [Hypomontagnella monticulosa]|nr:FAD/NAD(P)-binding domain-containing protein [Hypomontagnella monticulosa]
MSSTENKYVRVAIIGGGITGVILALGLQKRGVQYTLYERTLAFTEIGAGIGFSPNAERALNVVDPEVHRAYKRVASSSDAEEYFQWIDGYKTNELAARLLIGVDAFQGGRRSDFLEEWSKLIDSDKVKFGKELVSIDHKSEGRVLLKFKDGTIEESDIVIGCDGINSRVRRIMLGDDNPASYPSYTKKYCFRALVPMDKAKEALGEERVAGGDKSLNRFMYNGPNAHCIHYPVAKGQFMNILLVITDPNPWHTEDGKHTAPGKKSDAIRAYADWHPRVRAMIDLLPEELQKWAIFDMFENPAPRYDRDGIAIAGDAAHAVGPHLGSGAGFGIEDSLVLATLLEAANAKLDGQSQGLKIDLCRAALTAYNNTRYDRTQWLIGATREAGALFQWQDKEVGSDFEKFLPKISNIFHTIWNNDIDKMVQGSLAEYEKVLAKGLNGQVSLPN